MLGYTKNWVNTNVFTFSAQSHFGNGNTSTERPKLYYCGMVNPGPPPTTGWDNEEDCLGASAVFDSTELTTPHTFTAVPALHQPYGQYAALALNYLDPIGYPFAIEQPPIFETNKKIKVFDRDAGVLSDINATDV